MNCLGYYDSAVVVVVAAVAAVAVEDGGDGFEVGPVQLRGMTMVRTMTATAMTTHSAAETEMPTGKEN